MKTPSLVARIAAAAKLETATVLNVADPAASQTLGARVDRKLHAGLGHAAALRGRKRQASQWGEVRTALTPLIEQAVDHVLRVGLEHFRRGAALPVICAVSGSDSWVGGFAVSDLPFFRHQGDALSTAMSLRRAGVKVQFRALQASRALEIARSDPDSGYSPFGELEQRASDAALAPFSLPPDVSQDVMNFVDALAPGTIRAYCLPIAFAATDSAAKLTQISEAYADLGSSMRFPFPATFEGLPADRRAAAHAWAIYAECGEALRVLAGWVRCLALDAERPLCDICYRHVASRCRCGLHATKNFETREARLGKRIRPYYLERAEHLAGKSEFRWTLSGRLTPPLGQSAAIERVARREIAVHEVRWRAAALATQLQSLAPAFRGARMDQAQQIFVALLANATRASARSTGRSLSEIAADEKRQLAALSDVSLKGFCQAWFGYVRGGRAEAAIPSFGFDTRHPSLGGGAIDPFRLTRSLLTQRAWEEAEEEYMRRAMPGPEEIEPLLATGASVQQVADSLGISHQTVRTNRRPSPNTRVRYRLPP